MSDTQVGQSSLFLEEFLPAVQETLPTADINHMNFGDADAVAIRDKNLEAYLLFPSPSCVTGTLVLKVKDRGYFSFGVKSSLEAVQVISRMV
jgi:hypothetical protein